MKMKLTLLVVMLAACGCGLLPRPEEAVGVHRTAPAVEPAPVEPYRLTELVRQAAAYVQNRLTTWQTTTFWPLPEEVAAARQCAEAVCAYVGAPAAVPHTLEAALAVCVQAEAMQDKHNEAEAKHAEAMAEASRTPAKRSLSLTSGMLGTKLLLAGMGLGGVGIVGLVGWLWRKGKKLAVALAASNTAFGQVVGSVAAGLSVLPPEQEKAVKGEMAKVQDMATEQKVAEAKAK